MSDNATIVISRFHLLTLLEVAAQFRVSPNTVRFWVKVGKLKSVRICRRLLFHPDELDRFLRQHSNFDTRDQSDSTGAGREHHGHETTQI
jgi:excisionase family DNA binding protein